MTVDCVAEHHASIARGGHDVLPEVVKAKELLFQARSLLTEIGLQTYGRNPRELAQATDAEKVAMTERVARQANDLLGNAWLMLERMR